MVYSDSGLPGYVYRRNGDENNNRNNNRRGSNNPAFRYKENVPHARKSRSVQLSSIRCIEGPQINPEYKLRPYGERMVKKNGRENLHLKFGKLGLLARIVKDIFTTLVDLSWFGIITMTVLVCITNWLTFGLIYWGFASANNDLENVINHTVVTSHNDSEDHRPCVEGVHDFVSAFLFSMESSKTIGYGSRIISTACPQAITCLLTQYLMSAIFETWVIGVCFIKMASPDSRRKTTLFANNAVICTRDGKRCLLIRVANLRKSLLLTVSLRAKLITLRVPNDCEEEEGHQMMLEQNELLLENANTTMLTAPIEYCHVIDEESPLYNIPDSCFTKHINWFEIVAIMTGTVESTSLAMHMQVSYLSSEIKNKHRFAPVVSRKKDRYVVDFTRFHDVEKEPEFTGFSKDPHRQWQKQRMVKNMYSTCFEEDELEEDNNLQEVPAEEQASPSHQNECNISKFVSRYNSDDGSYAK